MKIIGIVLIVLQVLSILGGGLANAPAGGLGYSLGYFIGFFLPGIIGVVLLSKANNKK